jgi:hypothetical protein
MRIRAEVVGPEAYDRDRGVRAERTPDATAFAPLDAPALCCGDRLTMESPQPAVTEITVLGGERYRVASTAKDVERAILDAARGSIMEFAWFDGADTGERIGINPEHVVLLRVPSS